MEKIGEVIGAMVVISALGTMAILIASLPFAFLGWLIMAFSNIFGAGILITYGSSVIVGLVSTLVIGMLSR